MSGAAFYCVADERYFLGAVGLVNSLRIVGHDEPIYLLDCGLTGRQRELLAGQVTLVNAPDGAPPTLLKTIRRDIAESRPGASLTDLGSQICFRSKPRCPASQTASQSVQHPAR